METLTTPAGLAILTRNEGWFGRAPAAFRDAVLACAQWRTFRAGEPVYRVVDETGDLFGIVDGSVEIYSRFGPRDNPLMHIVHEGFVFGVGPLLTGQPRRVSAVARTDIVLARVPASAFESLLAAHPEWWRVMGTSALEYGDICAAAYGDMLIADNDRRCAAALLRLTGLRPPRRSRPERAAVRMTRDELAQVVNVSRATLVRILQGLERAGLVEQTYRMLRVRDAAGLAALVERDAMPDAPGRDDGDRTG